MRPSSDYENSVHRLPVSRSAARDPDESTRLVWGGTVGSRALVVLSCYGPTNGSVLIEVYLNSQSGEFITENHF